MVKQLNEERTHLMLHIHRAYVSAYECFDSLRAYKESTHTFTERSSAKDGRNLTPMERAIYELEQENARIKQITQRVRTDLSLPPTPIERFGLTEKSNERAAPTDGSQKIAD